MNLLGAGVSLLAVAGVAAIPRMAIGCRFGFHVAEDDWRDLGDPADDHGRIFVVRNCVRCGAEVMRMPLIKKWSMGSATLYEPAP